VKNELRGRRVLPNDRLGHRDRLSIIYGILSYLINSGHNNINMSMIRRNASDSLAFKFKDVIFKLVECEILDITANTNQKDNSRAFFKISNKGLELYNKIKIIKEMTLKNNFLMLEDYEPEPT
jgi:predicted transcriptional regulator